MVFDVVDRIEIAENYVRERIVRVRDVTTQRLDDGGRRSALHVHHAAADFVDIVIIGDDAQAQIAAVVDQHLPAHEPAIAVVGEVAGTEIFEETVPLVDTARNADRDRIRQWAGHISARNDRIVIAVGELRTATPIELRFLGDDRDDARRCVLAEQGRLRTTQHFDTGDVRQIGDRGSSTAAIDAVDEHADRWFDTGIVRAVAEAADEEAGIGGRLALADAERGNHGLQIANIADLVALQRFRAGDRHRNGNFLQGLFALRRGDDDLVTLVRILSAFIGIHVLAGFGLVLCIGGGRSKERERSGAAQQFARKTGSAGGNSLHKVLHLSPKECPCRRFASDRAAP